MSAVIGTQVDLFCEDVERCARSFEIRPPMDGSDGRPRYVRVLDPEGTRCVFCRSARPERMPHLHGIRRSGLTRREHLLRGDGRRQLLAGGIRDHRLNDDDLTAGRDERRGGGDGAIGVRAGSSWSTSWS